MKMVYTDSAFFLHFLFLLYICIYIICYINYNYVTQHNCHFKLIHPHKIVYFHDLKPFLAASAMDHSQRRS